MKYIVLVILLACTLAPSAQVEHAPSIEQCRTDARLWDAEWNKYADTSKDDTSQASKETDIGKTTYQERNDRIGELDKCRAVDPTYRTSYRDRSSYLPND